MKWRRLGSQLWLLSAFWFDWGVVLLGCVSLCFWGRCGWTILLPHFLHCAYHCRNRFHRYRSEVYHVYGWVLLLRVVVQGWFLENLSESVNTLKHLARLFLLVIKGSKLISPFSLLAVSFRYFLFGVSVYINISFNKQWQLKIGIEGHTKTLLNDIMAFGLQSALQHLCQAY